MVKGDRSRLHIRAGAHFLRGTHEHADSAGAAGLVERGFVFGLGMIVHEGDLLGRHPAGDQLGLDGGVDVPAPIIFGHGPITEHDLQAAADVGRLPEVVEVGAVSGRLPLGQDAGGDLACPAPLGGRGQVGAARVEGDVAAVVGDLEGVVEVHPAGVESVGAVAKILDEVLDLLAGLEVHDDVASGALCGQIHRHLIAGDGVGELADHADQVTDVGELADSGDRAQLRARRVEFDSLCGVGEVLAPRVNAVDSCVLKQVRAEVGLHDEELGEGVRDRSSGRETGDPLDVRIVGNACR